MGKGGPISASWRGLGSLQPAGGRIQGQLPGPPRSETQSPLARPHRPGAWRSGLGCLGGTGATRPDGARPPMVQPAVEPALGVPTRLLILPRCFQAHHMALYEISQVKARKKLADFENNTNISLSNNYVYFAVDKVANSSIKNSLFEIEYAPVGKKALTLYDERCSPLLSPYQLPPTLLREVLNSGNYFRFAFVRNPYSRLLSCYLDRILTASSKPRRQLNALLKRHGEVPDNVSFEQ